MENNQIGFQLAYCNLPTNKNFNITYTPDENTVSYTYHVYKNNELVKTVDIDSNRSTNIYFDATGTYQVETVNYDVNGNFTTKKSCSYILDKEKPILTVGEESMTLIQGGTIDIMGNVKAEDAIDGDLTTSITTNSKELDFKELGMKKLTYTVSDQAGNVTTKSVYVHVVQDPMGLLLMQTIIILSLIFLAAYILRYRHSLSLEKRIEKYSIHPVIDTRKSIYGKVFGYIKNMVNSVKQGLSKSVFLTNYSKRYEKYVGTIDYDTKDGMDFVAIKFLVSVLFVGIAVFSKAIQLKLIGLYEIWIPLLAGFFLPDVLFWVQYKVYRRKLENDLLQAIIVMNNAFKSGRSVTQAIYLVSTELKGVIAREYQKMYQEINLGLGVEEVFKRFADRVEFEEVNYLTASLSIINKTGGNIIRVFDSIEKNLVNKKKLRLELNSLTGGSKIIVNALFFVPILFVAFIWVVSPDYFMPLFTNPFGILLLVFMALYYVIYIICVRWIMKVRM